MKCDMLRKLVLLTVNLHTHVISGLPLLAYLTFSLQIYIGKTLCYDLPFSIFVRKELS